MVARMFRRRQPRATVAAGSGTGSCSSEAPGKAPTLLHLMTKSRVEMTVERKRRGGYGGVPQSLRSKSHRRLSLAGSSATRCGTDLLSTKRLRPRDAEDLGGRERERRAVAPRETEQSLAWWRSTSSATAHKVSPTGSYRKLLLRSDYASQAVEGNKADRVELRREGLSHEGIVSERPLGDLDRRVAELTSVNASTADASSDLSCRKHSMMGVDGKVCTKCRRRRLRTRLERKMGQTTEALSPLGRPTCEVS